MGSKGEKGLCYIYSPDYDHMMDHMFYHMLLFTTVY